MFEDVSHEHLTANLSGERMMIIVIINHHRHRVCVEDGNADDGDDDRHVCTHTVCYFIQSGLAS